MAAWNHRANEIFAAALEVSGANRQAFIEQTCGADAELRRQVEAMLSAHAQAGSFLDQPMVGEPLTTVEAAPSSGPPLPATGSVVQALTGPAVDLPARYQMEEEIARGGMGAVLRGRDTELKREIAVKVLLETHAGRTEFVQRFVEEAQIAGQLQHPGIAPVYDVGTASGKRPYFTMKLVKGQTLAKLLAERNVGHVCNVPDGEEARCKRAPRELPRLLKVFEAVCQTLAYAHAHNVIHRDLKPANVMVGAFGEVQVMDWGLAKVLASGGRQPPDSEPATVIATVRGDDGDSGQTHAGTAMGTPAYMAPEQARGEVDRVDERADVFGLGALLCEILTGQPPFPGKSSEAMRRSRKADLAGALSRLDACGADAELIALAKHCLASEPEDRPRHAGEVAEAMTSYLESVEARLRQAELERVQAQVKAVEERKRWRLTLALAASVLLTVLLGGGGYGWMQQQRATKRAETARKVDDALEKAAVLRGKAAAAKVGDLSGWTAAQAEAQRAQDLIDQGEAEPILRERVAAMQEEMRQGRAKAEERARDADAERRLVARLEAIRGEHAEHLDDQRTDKAYTEAFRSFGLDLEKVAPEEAAKLAGRPGTSEITAAIDEWWTVRRRLEKGKDERRWRRLLEAARVGDPDPWRNVLRGLIERPLVDSRASLNEVAKGKALNEQPAVSLVLLGRLLRDVGEREQAAAVLRQAWQRFPGDFWVNYVLGGSSWLIDRYERPLEAERFLTAAVAARPGSSAAHNGLGIALSEQGKVAEAILCFRRAIALDPSIAIHHANLGVDLLKQGKVDEAIAAHRHAIFLDPKNAFARFSLGNALASQNKVDDALASHRLAIRIDPKYLPAYINLGMLLCDRKHEYEKAIDVFRKAIQLDPKNVHAHHNLGVALRNQGKLDAAIAAFHRAVRVEPNNSMAYSSLGHALNARGDLKPAIAAFRRAVNLDSGSFQKHLDLGVALGDRGLLDEAMACNEKVIALAPLNPWGHNNLGSILYRKGKIDEAITRFRRAIELDRNNATAQNNLGRALDDKGLLDDAIVSFKTVVTLEPRNAWGHNNLGHVLFRNGQTDEAIACYRKAVELDPKNATAQNNLGRALVARGEVEQGIGFYEKALALDPRHAQARINLGRALEQQGKWSAALASYRTAMALEPTNAWLIDRLALARRVSAIEAKLSAFLDGSFRPAGNDDRLALALLCKSRRMHHTAARLYAEAFAADAQTGNASKVAHRYSAACQSALAAAGKSAGTALNLGQRLRWRRQALTWLHADLAMERKRLESGNPADRVATRATLRHWQTDPDLASLRDKAALAKLSAEERQACEKLWTDVAALLRQAQAKPTAK